MEAANDLYSMFTSILMRAASQAGGERGQGLRPAMKKDRHRIDAARATVAVSVSFLDREAFACRCRIPR